MNKENTYEMVNEILEIIGKHFFISEMDTFDRQVMSIEFSNLIKQKLNQVEQRKVEEIIERLKRYGIKGIDNAILIMKQDEITIK